MWRKRAGNDRGKGRRVMEGFVKVMGCLSVSLEASESDEEATEGREERGLGGMEGGLWPE